LDKDIIALDLLDLGHRLSSISSHPAFDTHICLTTKRWPLNTYTYKIAGPPRSTRNKLQRDTRKPQVQHSNAERSDLCRARPRLLVHGGCPVSARSVLAPFRTLMTASPCTTKGCSATTCRTKLQVGDFCRPLHIVIRRRVAQPDTFQNAINRSETLGLTRRLEADLRRQLCSRAAARFREPDAGGMVRAWLAGLPASGRRLYGAAVGVELYR